MECGHLSIGQQLQSKASETLVNNRIILKSILRAIIFFGKENIAPCEVTVRSVALMGCTKSTQETSKHS